MDEWERLGFYISSKRRRDSARTLVKAAEYFYLALADSFSPRDPLLALMLMAHIRSKICKPKARPKGHDAESRLINKQNRFVEEKIGQTREMAKNISSFASVIDETRDDSFRDKPGRNTSVIRQIVYELSPIYEAATGSYLGRDTKRSGGRGETFANDVLKALGIEAKPSTVRVVIDETVADRRATERSNKRE